MKKTLIEEFFDNDDLKKPKSSIIPFKANSDKIKKEENPIQIDGLKDNCVDANNKIDNSATLLKLKNNDKNNLNKEKKEESSKKNINTFQRNRTHFNYKDKLTLKFTRSTQNVLKSSMISNESTKFKINFFKYIKNFICKSSDEDVCKFIKASELLNKKLDIATYMKLARQFELFKSLHLNYYQDYSLNFMKKPNVNNDSDLEIINLLVFDSKEEILENQNNSSLINFNEMLYYYKQRQIEKNLNEMDLKITESLVDPIKLYLASNQTC